MAASFPFLPSTFLLDSDFLQNSTTSSIPKMSYGLMDDHIINSNNCFYNNYPSHDHHEILHQQMDAAAAAGISSVENNNSNNNTIIRSPPLSSTSHDGQSMSEKYKTTTDSSSMVIQLDEDNDDEQEIHKKDTIDQKKRRKTRDGSCLISGQSKDLKAKKQKKCNGGLKETDDEQKKKKKKTKTEKKNQKGVSDEVVPPTGYIHVRARRGQATDSHSLAERVRREKISERMKLLQSLVPGCDKVTGKALMLDEIINYVQSLQNQVEFLSMKLSSVNHPVFHDFGAADLDAFMVKSEKMCDLVSPLPSMQQSSTNSGTTPADQHTAFADNTTTFTTRHNYPSLEFQQGHNRPNALISSQVNENLLMDVDDQRQMFINQSWFNHLCSFQ